MQGRRARAREGVTSRRISQAPASGNRPRPGAAEADRGAESHASAPYRAIWEAARRIPRGRVATYGQIASLAGLPRQPRLAGYALHGLPDGSKVPWHRVVNAQGRISPRSSGPLGGGEAIQRRLLEREGVRFDRSGRIDLSRYQWKPRTRAKEA